MRLDAWLVEEGHFPSRARAQAAIRAGLVRVDGDAETRASRKITDRLSIAVSGDVHPWVSRAALKLDHALDIFPVDLTNRIVLDIGASTGGFTEVALARGAAEVFAVDVGHGQLSEKLASDMRVHNLEGLNAKLLGPDQVPVPVDVLVSDVSFIGLEKALPAGLALCAPGAEMIVLVKPQFEVGPEHVGKNGLVKDPALHKRACDQVAGFVNGTSDWRVRQIIDSPVKGGDGNREFLLWASRSKETGK